MSRRQWSLGHEYEDSMTTSTTITNVDDAKLVATIDTARTRVLFLTPGVSDAVADALAHAWQRLGHERVNVILDVDPEVCRLGYGTLEALKTLRAAATQAGTLVCHQPGVRIGLLIADETTLIFSPTPLLIEAGSTQPNRPNAVQLGPPPQQLSDELGLGDETSRKRVVGLDPVQPQAVDAVARDLAQSPPVKFNLARRVRVFTSRFQFVELEMTGCYISRRKVPIPSRLVGLSKSVQSQFHAHFDLVNSGSLAVKVTDGQKESVLSEEVLRAKRQQIIRDFLIPLSGYGSVVLRANKDQLIAAVNTLKENVGKFQDGIKADLQKHIDANAASLVDALLPAVKQNPPESYTKYHGPVLSDEHLRTLLTEDIKDAFGQAADLVKDMSVSLVFKDLAYESLVDEKFLEIARKAIPGVKFLHEEHETARAENGG